jgi:hypothetical protein
MIIFPFCFAILLLLASGCPRGMAAGSPVVSADGIADLQGFINGQLSAGEKRVVVPPGRYRVAPKGRCHLRFDKLENVGIVMNGVELVCTETTQAVSISDCRNLRISGLTIDYDPLPFTQGRITALGPENEWIEFEIAEGYPENLEMRIEIFDGKSGELKCPTRFDWRRFEKIGAGKYRVKRGGRFNPSTDLEEVGDILVTNSRHAPGGSNPHAIVSSRCADLVLEDVTIYASNCFSFFELNCDNSTYLRCKLDRRDLQDDPVKRSMKRIRSGDVDAFHSKYAKRGPKLLSCKAAYMGDDGVNICGLYYMVASSEGNTVRLITKNKPDLDAGDPLELTTYTGERLPGATVAEAPQKAGTTTPEESAFFGKQHMNASNRAFLSVQGAPVWSVVLDRPANLPIGSVLCATNRIGSGFVVKDCTFGPNRSRGILIKGSQGEVTGNTLIDNWGPAILITPEWWWLEAGCSDDVVVSGNKIAGCRDTAIHITAGGGNGKPAPAGAHNRIAVLDNTIQGGRFPSILVTSTDTGTIARNVIRSDATGDAIGLVNTKGIDVRDNTISPATQQPPAAP